MIPCGWCGVRTAVDADCSNCGRDPWYQYIGRLRAMDASPSGSVGAHGHVEGDVSGLSSDLEQRSHTDHTHAGVYAATDHTHLGSEAYRVGDLYVTTVAHADAAAVNAHHGYGTWSRFGAGRHLLLTDAEAAVEGGAATHAHSFTQPADHAALVHGGAAVDDHTVTQPADHSGHPALSHSAHAGVSLGASVSSTTGILVGTSGAGSAHGHGVGGIATGTSGAGTSHNHGGPADHAALSHAAHSGTAVGNHVFTQPGAHSAHVVTQPTAAGEASHTHTGASAGTTPKLFTSNTSSGVPGVSGGGTSHTHSMSGSAVDAHSAHSGGAVDAHAVTQPSAHSDHAALSHAVTGSETSHTHAGGAMSGSSANESTHTHAAGTVTDGGHVHDAGSVTQPSGHSDHAAASHTAHSGAAVSAHIVSQPADHAAATHSGGAVVDGSTAPLSITAFAWLRTA